MEQDHLSELAAAAEAAFQETFHRPPRWGVAAPGRVNLIGEHTDYNEGFVFPMAIDRHVIVAADLMPSDRDVNPPVARVHSTLVDERAEISLDAPAKPGHGVWSSYVAGTLAGCREAGFDCPAFEAVIHSNLPLGGGLSSSAALEVAVATLVETMTGQTLNPVTKALLCQKAEHDFAGAPCGIMDQFSSILGQKGHIILLDCRSQEVQHVPLADPTVRVLIINSNVKHALAGGEYAKRRAQCAEAAKILGVGSLRDATAEMVEQHRSALGDVCYRRARHVVSENQRTLAMAQAIRDNQWDQIGDLMYASHASLRDDFEVSCEELDCLVEAACQIGRDGGVFGSRMTGGGFGGCTVSLVHDEAVTQVAQTIERRCQEKAGIKPSIFVTQPSDGPRVLKKP